MFGFLLTFSADILSHFVEFVAFFMKFINIFCLLILLNFLELPYILSIPTTDKEFMNNSKILMIFFKIYIDLLAL